MRCCPSLADNSSFSRVLVENRDSSVSWDLCCWLCYRSTDSFRVLYHCDCDLSRYLDLCCLIRFRLMTSGYCCCCWSSCCCFLHIKREKEEEKNDCDEYANGSYRAHNHDKSCETSTTLDVIGRNEFSLNIAREVVKVKQQPSSNFNI